MFCPECGAKANQTAVFCTNCGKTLEESKEQPEESPKPTQRFPLKIIFIALAIILLISSIVGGGYYYLGRQKTNINQKEELESLVTLTPEPTTTVQPSLSPTPMETSQVSPTPTMVLKVYFANSQKSGGADCSQVFPLDRVLPQTVGVARASLNELFKGPTAEENSQGYSSFFSDKTKSILKNIKIVESICYVDLEDIRQIIPNANSSCGSAELLTEMETTLKQFPTIKKAVFAINGDPATFYQWLKIGCTEVNNFCNIKPFE